MKWVIDRFEEEWAILECIDKDETRDIPRGELPKGAREGQVLLFDGDTWVIDHAQTAARRAMIMEKFARLKKKSSERR